MDRTFKKNLKAIEKYELNSTAYTEGVVWGVTDNLVTKVVKVTKKDESAKNFKCNWLVRENQE